MLSLWRLMIWSTVFSRLISVRVHFSDGMVVVVAVQFVNIGSVRVIYNANSTCIKGTILKRVGISALCLSLSLGPCVHNVVVRRFIMLWVYRIARSHTYVSKPSKRTNEVNTVQTRFTNPPVQSLLLGMLLYSFCLHYVRKYNLCCVPMHTQPYKPSIHT